MSQTIIESKYAYFRTHHLLGENTPAWQEDKTFLDLYAEVGSNTLLSPERLYALYQYARNADYLEGDFAQVGVLRGGSAKMATLLMSDDKKMHLFDTFSGLPETHQEHDLYPAGVFNNTTEQHVRELFKDDPRVSINTGVFPDTVTPEHENARYAFVYLDVDIYTSNIDALRFFYPRMTTGGVILMDDYDWNNTPGIKTSVEEFVSEQGIAPQIITTKYQCMIQKL